MTNRQLRIILLWVIALTVWTFFSGYQVGKIVADGWWQKHQRFPQLNEVLSPNAMPHVYDFGEENFICPEHAHGKCYVVPEAVHQ